ncbi:hypothetical protein ET33_35390 [Paenibacillus tyrfis]|uniref:Uncharacterized protein n=1 Tax=Paenibacillus tyrfis TaxID=1501230 RepID=A0A081NSZ7_9BACL|nr:hypothetical protein ET33_35390 [Paenibacillus tyrfis]
MRKFEKVKNQNLSQAYVANPFLNDCIQSRYSTAKVVDMRDNHTLGKTKSGYATIRPKDPNKTY